MGDKEEEKQQSAFSALKTVKWTKAKSFQNWREDMYSLLEAYGLEEIVDDDDQSSFEKKNIAKVRSMLISALEERPEADAVARSVGKSPADIWNRLKEEYGNFADNKLLLREIRSKINTCHPEKHNHNFSNIRRFLETSFREMKDSGVDNEGRRHCLRILSCD